MAFRARKRRRNASLVLLHEYPDERQAFNLMVRDLRLHPKSVKRVIASWLVLEDLGYQDFPTFIFRQDARTVEQVFHTGLDILECTKPSSKPVHRDSELRPYYEDRKKIHEKFERKMNWLCKTIFPQLEGLERSEGAGSDRLVVRDPGLTARSVGEGSSGGGDDEGLRLRSSLNPNAPEFHGHIRRPQQPAVLNPNAPRYQPVYSRKMFLAFAYGPPPTALEIAIHFNALFNAPIVEAVNVDISPAGQPPLCAVVEFTDASVVAMIAGEEGRALITTMDGKHMWATPY
ncbi:hypothetical protein U1Q18_019334 [Sarracenia purpurea var. burkii]